MAILMQGYILKIRDKASRLMAKAEFRIPISAAVPHCVVFEHQGVSCNMNPSSSRSKVQVSQTSIKQAQPHLKCLCPAPDWEVRIKPCLFCYAN